LVNKDFLSVEPVNYFVKVFTNVMKKLFPSKSLSMDTISGESIDGKLVTAVNELKGGLTVVMQQRRVRRMPMLRNQTTSRE
jgi:hypothetical protein